MGMTLTEKILSEHAGKEVRAGEIAIIKVDLAYTQDGTGPLAVRKVQEMGFEEVYNPQRTIFFFDHASPSPRIELSNDHAFLRNFAQKTGIQVSDVGLGISHQVVAESYVRPGDVVIGAVYEKTVRINAKELKPTIACPHQVDNIKTIDEVGDIKVDQVYLGTSCNGRLEDFQIAAKILIGVIIERVQVDRVPGVE
jgi:homoaconitase/3-isopropylmalate dehydratase large subunit